MEVTTRKQAAQLGAKRYFTGKACPHGHVAERFTAGGQCVECSIIRTAKWRDENPEKMAEQNAIYRDVHRETLTAKRKAREAANLEAERRRKREHMRENRSRMARKLRLATPQCLTESDHAEMKAMYEAARQASMQSGIPHEVDHIVPMRGRLVCGLHVPWNLQVLTRFENRSKGNRHEQAERKNCYADRRQPGVQLQR